MVAYSSGNHAQGVAAAARIVGCPALIVMPSDAPRVKVEATLGYGAEVVAYDRWTESREEIAARIAAERGAIVVPAFDDPYIVAGQGTAGLEAARQLQAVGETADVLLCPASGGGLMAGIALAFERLSPATRLYVVEPQGYEDHAASLAAGRPTRVPNAPPSLCDSLMAPEPGAIPFAVTGPRLSGALAVSDEEALAAMAFAFRHLKLVLEPGGAVALAALLAGRLPLEGRTALVVASGGNVDAETFGPRAGGLRAAPLLNRNGGSWRPHAGGRPVAEWQGRPELFTSGGATPLSPSAARMANVTAIWFFGCLAAALLAMAWRSHQVAGWAAATADPSFWGTRHAPSFMVIGATIAAAFVPRLVTNLPLRLVMLSVIAAAGFGAAIGADRGFYGIVGSQVIVRPAEPWRPDIRFPLSAATPVLRRCHQEVHRGHLTNRVQFEVRYSGPEGATDIDLGRDVRLSNVSRWLGAMGDPGWAPLAGAYKTDTIQIAPSVRVAYMTGGNEPACMARYLSVLDADQQAHFARLLE